MEKPRCHLLILFHTTQLPRRPSQADQNGCNNSSEETSTGSYQSNMSFSAFQIQSKGQYNVTMRDINAKWNIKGKLETIEGEQYMKLYKFDILPEANDMKVSVSGLFPDPVLINPKLDRWPKVKFHNFYIFRSSSKRFLQSKLESSGKGNDPRNKTSMGASSTGYC